MNLFARFRCFAFAEFHFRYGDFANCIFHYCRFRYLLPLAALWLSACAVQQPAHYSTDSPLWQRQQQQLAQIHHYQARGAFAWQDGQRKLYAHFFWQQNTANNYRLLLSSPLGSREMDLQVSADGAQLTDNQGHIHHASNPAQLINQLTGISLPVNSLRQWLLGLPGDASDYQLNENYRLKSLNYQQQGKQWQVIYKSYRDIKAQGQSEPLALPAELELTQDQLRLKLKISHWTVS